MKECPLPPDFSLRLNAPRHAFEGLRRLLVFEPSGRGTRADAAPWLGTPLLHWLCVLTGVDGPGAGQLFKYLRLVVLIVAVR